MKTELKKSYTTSAELRQLMHARNSRCLLSFSAGKDSIAAWLAMRADGFDMFLNHFKAESDKYIDGVSLARKLGVDLPGAPVVSVENKISKRWLKHI
jgi:hypothetical protein